MSTKHAIAAARFLENKENEAWHDHTLWMVRTKRDKMSHSLPEWERLRELASEIKLYSNSHLDTLLEEFEKNAEVWGQCFWNEYHMLWYFSGFLGYLVLAHYIRVHLTWDRSRRFIVGLVLMVVGAALTIYSFYIQAIPGETLSTPVIEIGWAFCTINCVLLTAGTFLLFTCINRAEAPRLVTDMSKLSYGMYLMHIFWLGLWATVFKSTLELPTVAAIPCIAVSTFICCYVTTKLISFIPGSKWIIG